MVRPIFKYVILDWASVTKLILTRYKKKKKAIRLAYNLPMWTGRFEQHQIGNLEILSKTIQKQSSEYHARTIKLIEESKNKIEKHLLICSQIKIHQTSLRNIFLKNQTMVDANVLGYEWRR